MHRLPHVLVLVGLSCSLDALPLTLSPGGGHRSMGFIEKKKWTWKEASEESKTEWAIVLKRYFMVDMSLFELERHFDEALPPNTTSGGSHTVDAEALDKAQVKLAKLQANLEKAVLDQSTSDTTAGDMQRNTPRNHLSSGEKQALMREHTREQNGFFAVEASAQDVLQQANTFLKALKAAQQKDKQPSWSSIVPTPPPESHYLSLLPKVHSAPSQGVNMTAPPQAGSGKLAHQKTLLMLFQRYQEAAKTFHTDLGSFQALQSKAFTSFLAVSATVQKGLSSTV